MGKAKEKKLKAPEKSLEPAKGPETAEKQPGEPEVVSAGEVMSRAFEEAAKKPVATDDKGRPLPRRHRKADLGAKRLPHGSVFTMWYDAEKVEWSGSLYIPEGELSFRTTHGGSFGMLVKLDRQYREHLIEKFAVVEPKP